MSGEQKIAEGVTLKVGGVAVADPVEVVDVPAAAAAAQPVAAAAAQPAQPAQPAAPATPTRDKDFTFWLEVSPTMKIRVQEPSGNIVFRAARIIPPDLAQNGVILMMVQALLYVVETQEGTATAVMQPPIQTFLMAEALANKIGDEGTMILQAALQKHYPMSMFGQQQIAKLAADPNL